MEDTQAFHRIEEELLRKISEGVEVRFIYDDFGSIGYVKPEFMRRLNRQESSAVFSTRWCPSSIFS